MPRESASRQLFLCIQSLSKGTQLTVAEQKSKTSLRWASARNPHADSTSFVSVQRCKQLSSFSSLKTYHLKGPPNIRSSLSSAVHIQECPLFLMTDFLLRMAHVILESLHGMKDGPTYRKVHGYRKQSLNHWPSYSCVLLNQCIKTVPTRHLTYWENISKSPQGVEFKCLAELPQKTYCYQWTNKQKK